MGSLYVQNVDLNYLFWGIYYGNGKLFISQLEFVVFLILFVLFVINVCKCFKKNLNMFYLFVFAANSLCLLFSKYFYYIGISLCCVLAIYLFVAIIKNFFPHISLKIGNKYVNDNNIVGGVILLCLFLCFCWVVGAWWLVFQVVCIFQLIILTYKTYKYHKKYGS